MKTKRNHDGSIYRHRDGRRYVARKRYRDSSGVWREKKRLCASHLEARETLRDLHAEIRAELEAGAERKEVPKTFSALLDFYESEYVKPASYIGERKVSGLRSHANIPHLLKPLRARFGALTLASLSHDDLRHYKERRLKTRTKTGDERSISSVNNELRTLRRVLGIAVRQGWLTVNPFHRGDALICAADEVKRERILSRDEEARLLAACARRGSPYLRPLVVCAIDTAMRRGEQLGVTWTDVDLEGRTIVVRALNAKTNRRRTVPVTARLLAELQSLRPVAECDPRFTTATRVFPVRDFREAWGRALTVAKIEGFRWHDLRHVAITRMLEAGMPSALVMKISGHTQMTTFLRYVNTNEETAREAGRLLDAHHAEREAA
jgi:integrase